MGRTAGHQRGDPTTASGDFRRPPTGRIPRPPSLCQPDRVPNHVPNSADMSASGDISGHLRAALQSQYHGYQGACKAVYTGSIPVVAFRDPVYIAGSRADRYDHALRASHACSGGRPSAVGDPSACRLVCSRAKGPPLAKAELRATDASGPDGVSRVRVPR